MEKRSNRENIDNESLEKIRKPHRKKKLGPSKKSQREIVPTKNIDRGENRSNKKVRHKVSVAWQPTPEAKSVIDTTQDVYDNVAGASSDCNKFVKAVCTKLTVNPFSDSDDADAITNDIRNDSWLTANGWTGLQQDPAAAKAAVSSSGPDEFDLESFSWDDTPAAPAVTDSTESTDDFDSLFGDTKENAQK